LPLLAGLTGGADRPASIAVVPIGEQVHALIAVAEVWCVRIVANDPRAGSRRALIERASVTASAAVVRVNRTVNAYPVAGYLALGAGVAFPGFAIAAVRTWIAAEAAVELIGIQVCTLTADAGRSYHRALSGGVWVPAFTSGALT
jgi:hypothetical protein